MPKIKGATRKKLVRQWRRFADAYVIAVEARDDTNDNVLIGDVINDAPAINRINSARAAYLNGLVEAGLVKADQSVPNDDNLWEIHPINLEDGDGDLYEP